jgi:hypothetical protein
MRATRHLLFISLLLIASISCNAQNKISKSILKWEDAIQKFEQLDKDQADPENAILFVGSSSIRLWQWIEEDMAPYPVIQRGYGGAKFSDLNYYAERIIYPHEFRALAIFIANDISGSKHDKKPEEVVELFTSVLETVRKKNSTTPVFLIAITPTRNRWDVWHKTKEANRQLKQKCSELADTYFIDTEALYLNENGEPKEELFISDKLHLNEEGYDVWTGAIKAGLDKVLKE